MGKMGKKQVLCILLGIILAVAGYLVEKRDGALEDGNRLNRYAYGEGERQQEVWVRGLCEKEIPVEISLGEREYAEEDAKKALLEAGGKGRSTSRRLAGRRGHPGPLDTGGCGMDSDGWDSFK